MARRCGNGSNGRRLSFAASIRVRAMSSRCSVRPSPAIISMWSTASSTPSTSLEPARYDELGVLVEPQARRIRDLTVRRRKGRPETDISRRHQQLSRERGRRLPRLRRNERGDRGAGRQPRRRPQVNRQRWRNRAEVGRQLAPRALAEHGQGDLPHVSRGGGASGAAWPEADLDGRGARGIFETAGGDGVTEDRGSRGCVSAVKEIQIPRKEIQIQIPNFLRRSR